MGIPGQLRISFRASMTPPIHPVAGYRLRDNLAQQSNAITFSSAKLIGFPMTWTPSGRPPWAFISGTGNPEMTTVCRPLSFFMF
jgi:hypothetical protein